MVGSNGRKGKITPVDEDYLRRQAEQQNSIDQDRQMQRFLSRERSSAYWFAATKWGMIGLIFGIILGGAGMYVASIATLPIAQEALFKGAAMRDAQEKAKNDPSTPARLTTPPASPTAP
jgi:hypothetical protein